MGKHFFNRCAWWILHSHKSTLSHSHSSLALCVRLQSRYFGCWHDTTLAGNYCTVWRGWMSHWKWNNGLNEPHWGGLLRPVFLFPLRHPPYPHSISRLIFLQNLTMQCNLPPAGAYHDKITAGGEVLSDHMLFGTVVATMLIVVVTAQGGSDSTHRFYQCYFP